MLCGCGNTDTAENGENVMIESFSEEIQADETVQANISEEDTPFSKHGRLSVSNWVIWAAG